MSAGVGGSAPFPVVRRSPSRLPRLFAFRQVDSGTSDWLATPARAPSRRPGVYFTDQAVTAGSAPVSRLFAFETRGLSSQLHPDGSKGAPRTRTRHSD